MYVIVSFIVDDFMKTQLQDYNIGKRHLANMMGRDPEFFTQQDVDVSFCLLKLYVHGMIFINFQY